ncbi:MAG: hypothetical protein WC455_28265 [Dehalococcoidia bacterium]|jgi:hypothetical protein
MQTGDCGKAAKEIDSSIILNRLDSCIEIAKENAERAFRLETCGEIKQSTDALARPIADFTGAVNDKLDALAGLLEDTRASLRRFI